MNTVKQIMCLFLILLALTLTAWYYGKMHPTIRLDNEALSSTVDTTIIDLTLRQYNSEGVLANILITPEMQHIPKDDIHLIKTPHISIAQLNEPPWVISSKKAKSYKGGEYIIFSEQVIVHQNAEGKTQESTIKTEEVTYYPKDKKATSDLFVTFEQPGNITQSTGMNAWLDEKRVELLHQARGSYAPRKA